MTKCSKPKFIHAGTFKGKKITVAATDRVDGYQFIAIEFMSEIFDLPPEDYAMSDESELRDFASFFNADASHAWQLIEERYGLAKTHVGSENLADIFSAIARRNAAQ